MGLLDHLLRRRHEGIRVRCGMCRVVTYYPRVQRDQFVIHSCDSDVLVREPDPGSEDEALDLFVRGFGNGARDPEARRRARDRLLYEVGEAPIPGLEDLLFRLKYEPAEAFPFPELRARMQPDDDMPRIDWSNELEMALHRMKKFAITRRTLDAAPASTRPILQEKLERLKTAPLVPLEED